MPCQKRTLNEPLIRELLSGLVRCGKRGYYQKDPLTGLYCEFPARIELMALGMSQATGSRLLREAAEAGLIFVRDDEISASDKASKMPELSPEDDEDERNEPEESGGRQRGSPLGLSDIEPSQLRRYQLVKSGDWFGYWDDEYGYQELVSKDKADALERIYQLQRHGSDEFCVPQTLGRFNT